MVDSSSKATPKAEPKAARYAATNLKPEIITGRPLEARKNQVESQPRKGCTKLEIIMECDDWLNKDLPNGQYESCDEGDNDEF